MIKVTTSHGTEYIIDEVNEQIKRIPRPGTTFSSILRGFNNVGEWQPYIEFDGLELDNSLQVHYPDEQLWSISSPITTIDYGYEETNNDNE